MSVHEHRINHEVGCFVGTCPACGEPVLWDDPDGPVWTCPADLDSSNPYAEPANPKITEAMREAARVYSNCGDDFGFACYDALPLHAACYEKGE